MVAKQDDLVGVVAGESAEVFQACHSQDVVVCPLGSERGNRMVVPFEFYPQVISIPDVQYPTVLLPDCHPTMSESMAEQRNK